MFRRDTGGVRADEIVVNSPRVGIEWPDVRPLWTQRELLYFLTWRDVRVRYKQTALGALWAIVQPLSTMLIFTFVFGRVAQLSSEGVPYALFVLAALVPWTFFATAITQASQSLVLQEKILTRVYFPRLLIPVASICAVGIDLAITLVLLVVMLLVYGVAPTTAIVALPGIIVLAVLAATAVGLWLAAINVRYRDVRYISPFLVQLWFFATPVAYTADVVPDRWRPLFDLNPMVGVVEGFRWSALGTEFPGRSLAIGVTVIVVALTASLFHFRRLEATFADEV